MINIREKLFYVAFQNPAYFCFVLADFPGKLAKSFDRSMRSFPDPTGIRIGNKCFFEKRIKDPINRVMQQSVTNRCLVNIWDSGRLS